MAKKRGGREKQKLQRADRMVIKGTIKTVGFEEEMTRL